MRNIYKMVLYVRNGFFGSKLRKVNDIYLLKNRSPNALKAMLTKHCLVPYYVPFTQHRNALKLVIRYIVCITYTHSRLARFFFI